MSGERSGTGFAGGIASEMRNANTPEMRNRRWIAGLSAFSGVILGGIGLFQMGILKRIPEPGWRHFDSEKVTGSADAYAILQTPDALLGGLSYAVTGALAGMGSPDRARTSPVIPAAMGAKLAMDAAISVVMTSRQWTRYHAFCFWCLLTTGATISAALLGIREVSAASRSIRKPRLWRAGDSRRTSRR